MSRLPRLAVVVDATAAHPDPAVLGSAGAAALAALVDSGLDAVAVVVGAGGELPARAAARTLDEFGLIDRLTALPGPLTLSSAPGWRPPFTLPGGGLPGVRHTSLPGQDAIVFVGAPPAPGLEPPSATATSTDLGTGTSTGTRPGSAAPPPPWSRGRFFGGVFHTELEGVFRVSPDPELAGPQGRWIGEYLRGRYLLPARSVMIRDPAAAGVRRPARRYLKGLARELRQGHARASRAGYPLPVPARAR